jgi:hypothetical protein
MKGKHKFSVKKLESMNIGSQQYGDQLRRLISNKQLNDENTNEGANINANR